MKGLVSPDDYKKMCAKVNHCILGWKVERWLEQWLRVEEWKLKEWTGLTCFTKNLCTACEPHAVLFYNVKDKAYYVLHSEPAVFTAYYLSTVCAKVNRSNTVPVVMFYSISCVNLRSLPGFFTFVVPMKNQSMKKFTILFPLTNLPGLNNLKLYHNLDLCVPKVVIHTYFHI